MLLGKLFKRRREELPKIMMLKSPIPIPVVMKDGYVQIMNGEHEQWELYKVLNISSGTNGIRIVIVELCKDEERKAQP